MDYELQRWVLVGGDEVLRFPCDRNVRTDMSGAACATLNNDLDARAHVGSDYALARVRGSPGGVAKACHATS